MNISNTPYQKSQITLPWVCVDSHFTEQELNTILALCSKYELNKSKTVENEFNFTDVQHSARVSSNCFIFKDNETSWFFEKVNQAFEAVNNTFYNFEFYGYSSFQYAEYYGSNGGKYDAHMDLIMSPDKPSHLIDTRKLSMSLLLSEPNKDFTGGNFFIHENINPTNIELVKGRMIFFPSFMLHGVAPVTSGVRKSIVVWVDGPKFK